METERNIKRKIIKELLSLSLMLVQQYRDLMHLLILVCTSQFKLEREITRNVISTRKHFPRIENYVDGLVATFTNEEFKTHFRMSRQTYQYILSNIEQGLKRKTKGTPMFSAHTQFLLTLLRLGTPECYRSICQRFNIGRSTSYYITERVVTQLIKLAPAVIKWPVNEGTREVWHGFQRTSGFPKVIGAIDGTHINILAPKEDPATYVNCKGRHSIQLQAICDHTCRFTHCYAGHMGSIHDHHVFYQSEVYKYLGDVTKFPEDCHLVGDIAYKLNANVLTPYRDNGYLTQRQHNYNYCHASARIAIERAFGLLKGRFRCLLTTLAIDRVKVIPKYIIACCVLHNFCLMSDDDLHIEWNEDILCHAINDVEYVDNAAPLASAKRDLICESLPLRDVNKKK